MVNLFDIALAKKLSGGGGGGLDLVATKEIGLVDINSTSEVNLNKSVTLSESDVSGYDLILVITSADEKKNNYHYATADMTIIYGSTAVLAMNGKIQYKTIDGNLTKTANNTQAYGVYHKAAYSSGDYTVSFFGRYNNNATGFIKANYTAKIYGIKLPV